MAGAGEQPHGRNALRVACPRVDQLLGNVALGRGFVSSEVNVQILRDMEVGASKVVIGIVN